MRARTHAGTASLIALALAVAILAPARAHADPSFQNPDDAPQVGPLYRLHAPSTVARRLDRLVADVERRVAAGERPIVIFDVDDTLFRGELSYQEATILPGAAAYVNRLARAGASIAYVTGRPQGLKAGTRAQLAASGLPIGGAHRLYMKHGSRSVIGTKQGHLATLGRRGTVVAAFENELKNTRMWRERLPGAAKVFHHATRSTAPDPARARGRAGITVFYGFPPSRATDTDRPTRRLATRQLPLPSVKSRHVRGRSP